MTTPVLMPRMGYDMKEGKIIAWLKGEGEKVNKGEAIAEIETSKVNIEIEAFRSGTLLKLLAQPGATILVGQPIALLGEPGEKIEAVEKTEKIEKQPESLFLKASPLAKKIAKEHGLDLHSLQGRGPGGRIVRADVEAALVEKKIAEKVDTADFEDVPLSRMREAIAASMALSKRDIPHFYLTAPVQMDAALDLLEELKALNPRTKITLNDLIAKAIATALIHRPELNASFQGKSIRLFRKINLAIAVAVEGGLIAPVISDAGGMTLLAIAEESKRLIEGAKSGRLKREEYLDATFTLTNLGAFGVESFQAIINPPQGAILAVGAARKEHGKPTIMRATLSVDHRVADGAQSAECLAEFKRILEAPLELLLEGGR